jgi:hypothetical protein
MGCPSTRSRAFFSAAFGPTWIIMAAHKLRQKAGEFLV